MKQKIEVFFVNHSDPIYSKLEQLDIVIRLVFRANTAQVLAELEEYTTEVDAGFACEAVQATGR